MPETYLQMTSSGGSAWSSDKVPVDVHRRSVDMQYPFIQPPCERIERTRK